MLTVLIPAYNEADAIGATIDEIDEVLKNNSDISNYEILVVDDGSGDDSGANAEKHGARVIRNLHNLGYGRSLKNGIAKASNDTICIIDADLTYPANRIPDLFNEFQKGYDLVVGARKGSNVTGILAKGPLRWILRRLVEFAAGRSVPDPNSGLRIFSKATIKQFEPYLCDTFSFTTSMTLGYMSSSKFVKHMPIEYHDRNGQTKVKLFIDSLRTLQYIVQAILYYNPMKIFTLFSIFCVLIGIIGFGLGMVSHIRAFYYLSIGSLLISIIMFGFGLLADLLRQILNKRIE